MNEWSDDEVVARALEVLEARLAYRVARDTTITCPDDARAYLRLQLADERVEVFAAMWLDQRGRLIGFERLFSGTIDCASVHPREVVRRALEVGAASVILAHNHPSGVPEPSSADERITRRLRDALALIEIKVRDHFVVGDGEPVSLAERGLM